MSPRRATCSPERSPPREIDVRTGASAARVSHESGQFAVHLDGDQALAAQRVLVATGRRTDLAALGVDAVGVDERARAIEDALADLDN